MIWQEIVKAALIGTGRANLPPVVTQASKALGIDQSLPPETQLLHVATAYAQMHKAGKEAIQWTEALPDPGDTSDANVCPPEATRFLYRILGGEYEELLPEFIQNLVDRQMSLPPETLPDLLQQALNKKEFWAQIKGAVGKRGQWLVQLNPAWQAFSNRYRDDIWETGLFAERLAYLRHLRQQNPRLAIEYLNDTWEQEGHKDRLKFIQALEINLGKEDEAFLENCLDIRRKDLRRICSRLLATIPDAALPKRIIAQLDELIEVKKRSGKKEKLLISLPDTWEASMARDGIDPIKKWPKGGVKASRFLQMMTLVPPKHWEQMLEQSPEEAVGTFVRSEWSSLLMQSALDACCLHLDADWMKALLTFWIDNHHKERWEDLKVQPLLKVLPSHLLNELLIETLQKSPGYIEAEAPIAQLLKLQDHLWEDRLSMLFIKNLQQWLEKDQNRHWGQWHLRELLKNAAFRCSPELYDYLHQRWPRNAAAWSGWQDEIDDFLRVLRFRKQMKASLG